MPSKNYDFVITSQRRVLLTNAREWIATMRDAEDGATLTHRSGRAEGYVFALLACGVLDPVEAVELFREALDLHNELVPSMRKIKVPIKQSPLE